MSKRTLSETDNARRMREKKHKQEQENEMLKNEIATLTKRVTNLESMINVCIQECECSAGEALGKRFHHGRVQKEEKEEVASSKSLSTAVSSSSSTRAGNETSYDPVDDEEDDFGDDLGDEERPRLSEKAATFVRVERAWYIGKNNAYAAYAMMKICTSHERSIKQATRFSKSEYDHFSTLVCGVLPEVTFRGTVRERMGTEKDWVVADEVQVFIYLFYVKHYPTFWLMSHLFALCELYLSSILKRVNKAILLLNDRTTRIDGGLHWPLKSELKEIQKQEKGMKPKGMETVAFALDGARIWIRRPKNRQDLFNAKDHQPALNGLIMCTFSGDLLFASNLYESQNENTIVQECSLRQLIKDSGLGVDTDAGFNLNSRNTVKIDGEIQQVFSHGPQTLHLCKRILVEILDCLIQGEKKTWIRNIDAAFGHLLEQVAHYLHVGLHNCHLASSGRIVVENLIGDLKEWKILQGWYRSYWRELNHEGTLHLNDIWHSLAFMLRWMKVQRGYFERTPGWQNRFHNDERGYRELVNVLNPDVWKHRVQTLAGKGKANVHILQVETGSLLFIKLWSFFCSENESDDWKILQSQQYKMATERKKEFERWIETAEKLYSDATTTIRKKVKEKERERHDAAGAPLNDSDDEEVDCAYTDELGFVFSSLPHKRKPAESVKSKHPWIATRAELYYNSSEDDLDKLSNEDLIKLILYVPTDVDNGKSNSLYTMAKTVLETSSLPNAQAFLRLFLQPLDDMEKTFAKIVLQRRLKNLFSTARQSEEEKVTVLKNLCEAIKEAYEFLDLQ